MNEPRIMNYNNIYFAVLFSDLSGICRVFSILAHFNVSTKIAAFIMVGVRGRDGYRGRTDFLKSMLKRGDLVS